MRTRPEDIPSVRKSENLAYLMTLQRPVSSMSRDFPNAFSVPAHEHDRAQLIYPVAGVMEVAVDGTIWVIPPQCALWVPGHVRHSMTARGGVSMRTVYIQPSAMPKRAPDVPCNVQLTDLLRALILRAVQMPDEYDEDGLDGQITKLLLMEIQFIEEPSLKLAEAKDPRLRRLCDHIRANPSCSTSLHELAPDAGASVRTLTRLAREELGVPIKYWRQQIRLLHALPRLAGRESVTSVALSAGYDTTSAFTAMFTKTFGKTPSQYIAEISNQRPPVLIPDRAEACQS